MDINNTKIITFNDLGNSSFTLKKDKSYNFSKFSTGYFLNIAFMRGRKKFCFKIQNCVSSDEFIVEYYDQTMRNNEYDMIINEYKKFNNMQLNIQ